MELPPLLVTFFTKVPSTDDFRVGERFLNFLVVKVISSSHFFGLTSVYAHVEILFFFGFAVTYCFVISNFFDGVPLVGAVSGQHCHVVNSIGGSDAVLGIVIEARGQLQKWSFCKQDC